MMAAAPIDRFYAEDDSGDTHSLMEASIEDFEEQERHSPLLPGFRSEHDDSEIDDRSSVGQPWSPPGFKNRNTHLSGWFRQDPYGKFDLRPSTSPSRSRQTSPEIFQDAPEGDPDITLVAVNTPLPAGMDSPVRERSPEVESRQDNDDRGWDQAEPVSPPNPSNCKISYCLVSLLAANF